MVCPKVIVVLYILLVYQASYTTTFLLNGDQCLAPPPCTCSGRYVHCDSKNLASVPAFIQTDNHIPSLIIYLSYNHITSIHANTFSNISSANATQIKLLLYYNNINSIEASAFTGIENATYHVDLEHNNLTSIPAALLKLTGLQTLLIQNNPIQSLDPSTMSSLGHFWTSFSISLDHFTSWPTELHLLRKLNSLTIDKVPFSRLNDNPFHGLETTLTTLTITNSKLERIPLAVCHLVHLQGMTFSNNPEAKSPIVQPCHMTSVTSLNLNGNQLHEFPDIFNEIPSITSLSLQKNQIRFIDADIIPFHSNLTRLNLNDNQFTSIPYAVNKLKSLITLFIAGNKLLTVEDNSLTGARALSRIFLEINPLEYISSHAFKHNTQLSFIDLGSTQLGTIPRAVMSIPHLSYLDLRAGKPIECTCSMSYLKPWNVTSVNILGTCESSTETLKDFIMKALPQCP